MSLTYSFSLHQFHFLSSVRKQIKIRPGFTPQEDVRRFRGTKQAQMDANALPKGHIIGWVPPPGATKPDVSGANRPSTASSSTPTTKAAKKNAKRKEKREREKSDKAKEEVPDNWEDDEEQVDAKKIPSDENVDSGAECLSSQLEKLDVK